MILVSPPTAPAGLWCTNNGVRSSFGTERLALLASKP